MKLKQIELDGFGKLVKRGFQFSPGLNLVYGRNEAGKSTLQRSILAGLYGFFDSGSVTSAKRAMRTAYEPWDTQATYGLKLIFELEGGAQYRVERTFGANIETTLVDLKRRRSINSKFSSASHGRLFFADELLGMPKDVFENTCLVRQAELAALEKSATAITDTLLKLSASASQESTASQAIEILAATIKEQIGTPRSRTKPLPEAQRRLDELQAARNQLLAEHQALANQRRELAQVEENFKTLQRERDKAEYQRLLAQRQVVKKQSQTIEQAEAEVARCERATAEYEKWAAFPADTQPKIQRLSAQHEKALSDGQQAKLIASHAQQRLATLKAQLEPVHNNLGSTVSIQDVPDIENQPAETTKERLQDWLDNELSLLNNQIQAQQDSSDAEMQFSDEIIQIGHAGIARDRQDLGKLEFELSQAIKAERQIEQAAQQAGIPEEQWETILAEAQANVEQWQEWMNFPAELRDELLRLTAQYSPLKEPLATDSGEMATAGERLGKLQTRLEAVKAEIAGLEKVRNVPQQEKLRIQEIAAQLEGAKQTAAAAEELFAEIDQEYQDEQKAFDQEKQALSALEQLGLAGLTILQQRWLNARQQLASAQERFEQSQASWNRVGMPVAEFQRLESMAKEIQSGIRPAPEPRRGCRSYFLPQPKGMVVDETPTEITIYSQVQPIFAEFAHQQNEIRKYEEILAEVENELRQRLGRLVPETIQENTFTVLLQLLQNIQERSLQIEQKRISWNSRQTQYQQADERRQKIQNRLENELQSFGFPTANIEEALPQYFEACEQKEKLVAAETSLERIQAQIAIESQQWNQYEAQQQSLAQIEEKIIKLLAEAGIQAKPASLTDDIQYFEAGLEKHRQWKTAQAKLEQLRSKISELESRLTSARSVTATADENLSNFRKKLVVKYQGRLPYDFTDQTLAELDAALQIKSAKQSGIERAKGQLEQLRLQAKSIVRDISDWAEKEATAEQLKKEIFAAIQAAGIETEPISVDETLGEYDEALQGFRNWQQAQRAFDAAVQAQQAVAASTAKLEAEIASLEEKIAAFSKRYPTWKDLTASDNPEAHERNYQRLNDQVLTERDRLTRLKDAVSRGSKKLQSLAELDEAIELANAEIQRLNHFSQILELASNELSLATHEFQRLFAPRLERIVVNGLEQITAGRYRQVRIDPNSLDVHVLAPEVDQFVDIALLSTGTRDLIYLILRMGLTQLMSYSGEKLPLLLDDPLVEFDYPRQQAALTYLELMAEQTQVFLFTKDDDIVTWVMQSNKRRNEVNLIEL